MTTIIDFAAARRRIEASAAHEIEIDARRIPVIPAYRPTILEQIRADIGTDAASELVFIAFQESF